MPCHKWERADLIASKSSKGFLLSSNFVEFVLEEGQCELDWQGGRCLLPHLAMV